MCTVCIVPTYLPTYLTHKVKYLGTYAAFVFVYLHILIVFYSIIFASGCVVMFFIFLGLRRYLGFFCLRVFVSIAMVISL